MDVEDFTCPICCELLWKPAVNFCSHVYCHSCLYKSMNSFAESKCPLCRSPFRHFPFPCSVLFNEIRCRFPKEFEKRKAEAAEDEATKGVFTPEVSEAEATTPQCTVCNELCIEPTVLSCGCIVCAWPCLLSSQAAGACNKCRVALPDSQPKVCKLLQQIARDRDPEGYEDRSRAARQLASSLPGGLAAGMAAGGAAGAAAASPSAAAAAASPDRGAAAGPHCADQEPSGGDVGREGGGGSASGSEPGRPQPAPGEEPRAEGDAGPPSTRGFVWYGVGCDRCGVLPIVGTRFKCEDCPESIGFDLCGQCWDACAGGAVHGRFNQRHTQDHRMLEVQPRRTLLHYLADLHPELSVEQIMSLVEIALSDNNNNGGAGGAAHVGGVAFPDHHHMEVEEVLEDAVDGIGLGEGSEAPSPGSEAGGTLGRRGMGGGEEAGGPGAA